MVRRAAILAASVLVSLSMRGAAMAQQPGAPGAARAASAAAASAARASPAGPAFTLLNRSGRPVAQLYASPAGLDEWGYDRLGTITVPPGGRHLVRLGAGAGCRQDLRVLYRDGARQDLPGLDLCVTREVVLGVAAAAAGPMPGPAAGAMPGPVANQAPGPLLALRNQGRLPVAAAFVSPAARREWGEDQLATRPLPPGGTFRLRLPPGECIYDVKIIATNGAAQEQRGLDLCARPGVTFR
jgi:hypothetical protein